MSMILMTLRRVSIVIFPLLVIAVMSSNEWVARAQMIENTTERDLVYSAAVYWDDTINSVLNKNDQTEDLQIEKTGLTNNVVVNDIEEKKVVESNEVALTKDELVLPSNTLDLSKNETNPIVYDDLKTDLKLASPIKELTKSEQKVDKKEIRKILMVGDSLMNEVAFGFKNNLDKSIKVKDLHKSSTGLTNKDYYDWPTVAKNETKNYQPDLVFIHLGGNDGQDLKENGKFIRLYSPEWANIYEKRAEKLITEIQNAAPNAEVVWIGLPGMRDQKYERKTAIIREAQRNAAKNKGITYIDGGDAIGKTYVKQKKIGNKMTNLRRTDGIHYSREGGEQIALLAIKEKIN